MMMEQELLELLNSDNNKKYYRYLLIDTLTTVSDTDFIALNNIKDLLGDETISTIVRPDLAHDLNVCPKLIIIGKPDQKLEERLLHFSVIEAKTEVSQSKRYVCGWMTSEYPPEVIKEQMVNIGLLLNKYYGNGFIPFYEPFKMQLLHQSNLICPEFISEILNCFQSYIYPTINQTIKVIDRLNYKPKSIDIFLSEEAKFYQQHASVIFELYQSQFKIYSEVNKDVYSINLMNISKAYQLACFCGLRSKSDQFVFSLMTLRYGDLLSNQYLKNVIDEAKIDEGSLSRRFQEISRQQFLSIKN